MFSISLTESSRWDLALLPQSADTIFAVIYTILSPAESSRIVLYDVDWQPLAYQFQLPEIEKFFREPYPFSLERMEILKQDLKMCSVSLSFSPRTRALIAKVSTTNAPEDDLADLKHLLFPLCLDRRCIPIVTLIRIDSAIFRCIIDLTNKRRESLILSKIYDDFCLP